MRIQEKTEIVKEYVLTEYELGAVQMVIAAAANTPLGLGGFLESGVKPFTVTQETVNALLAIIGFERPQGLDGG